MRAQAGHHGEAWPKWLIGHHLVTDRSRINAFVEFDNVTVSISSDYNGDFHTYNSSFTRQQIFDFGVKIYKNSEFYSVGLRFVNQSIWLHVHVTDPFAQLATIHSVQWTEFVESDVTI
jgi:hypothetical protein